MRNDGSGGVSGRKKDIDIRVGIGRTCDKSIIRNLDRICGHKC